MVTIKPFHSHDISDEYLEAINSDQAQYLFTGERKWTRDQLANYVSKVIADPDQKMFAIMEDGKHVGNIKITLDRKNKTCGYGRLLWKSGSGVGTEALRLMIGYVFANYPIIDVITDMAASDNTASLISNLKAGMKPMGFWKDKLCIAGKRVDGIPIGITRREYYDRKNEKEEIDVNFGF